MSIAKLFPVIMGGKPSYKQRVINFSPLAYWPLNEALGAAAAINYGTLGTAANAAWGTTTKLPTLAAAAAPGGGLCPSFDGGDFVNIYTATLNAAFPKTAGSIVIWCKVSAAADWTDGAAHAPLSMSAAVASFLALWKTITNNTFQWRYKGVTEKNISKTVSTTAWFHIALTWNDAANQAICYYNGAQEGSTLVDFGTWNAANLGTTTCAVGASNASDAANGWKGNLAHPAIFGKTLTPAEVANLYSWGV